MQKGSTDEIKRRLSRPDLFLAYTSVRCMPGSTAAPVSLKRACFQCHSVEISVEKFPCKRTLTRTLTMTHETLTLHNFIGQYHEPSSHMLSQRRYEQSYNFSTSMHLANYPCVTAIAIHISRIFKRISPIWISRSLLPRLGGRGQDELRFSQVKSSQVKSNLTSTATGSLESTFDRLPVVHVGCLLFM